MHHSVLRRTALGLAVALSMGLTSVSFAADVNGRIRGTVTDPSAAVVPGVVVTATNQATGVKFNTKTNADGSYLFPELPVGTYTISVAPPGFKAFKATGIVLTIDQEYVESVKLGVGDTSETLEVAADAVQVNTTDMQLNNIVDSTQMVELPLIGRNFTGLELIEPGVQASSDRFGTFSVSGSQTQQSEFLINGADANDIALNTLAIAPNLDAIDQFNLIEGPLNAEYDRNSGGIVSATIKQGTNHFHGDAFEFYRDTFLNTNNFFQKSVTGAFTPVSPYHQNIFGGTVGGPILRDKLFFFGAYQGTHQRVPEGSGNSNVYSSAMLGGNFTADLLGTGPAGITGFSSNPIPSTVSIPGCTTGEAWSTCLASGTVPTSAFNPVAVNLVKQYVPAANSGTYGYLFNETENTTQNQEIGRVDFALNPKNQFTVLGIYFKSNLNETLPFTGASLPGFGDQDLETIQQYTFDYVRQLSSTAVNDFALHYTRFNYQAVLPQKVVSPSSVGFDITPQNAAGESVPFIGVTSYFNLGFSTNGPQPRIDQVAQVDDNFSKVLGKHQLKLGYDGRKFNVSNPFSNSNNGAFGFNNTSSTYGTGDPGLDFLLGIPATYSQGSGATIQAQAWLNYLYAQDTWKATNNLTLDYGLGYQIDTPLQDHQYQGEGISCFIPGEQSTVFPQAPTGLVYPGDPGCSSSAQAFTHYTELGPRIGFAWSPDLGILSNGNSHKFAIRGGFGIYYNRTEEESALQTLATPPFGTTSGGASDFGGVPELVNPFADINGGLTTGANGAPGAASEPNKFPFVFPAKGSNPSFASVEPIYNISTYGPSFRSPYSENFQLSLEREFPSRTVTRISYVGSFAHHNQNTYEADYITAAGHAACVADPTCVADRNLQNYYYPSHTVGNNSGVIEEGAVGSMSSSNYNALQASVEKAQTHGLLFQLSYTYSHALDDSSSFENSGFGGTTRGYNQYDKVLNYGSSAFDARQRLVFSPVYIVPTFKSHGAFAPVNLALSGWEISGILTLATGFPYDISYGGATSRSLWCSDELSFYACPDVPVQTGPLGSYNPRIRNTTTGYGNWFNAANFAAEPIGGFGNIGRDSAHGPGINNTNLILAKNINLDHEGIRRLQLRMESDNVFNHTQFTNPVSTYGSGTFGQITSAASARQTQLAAKFYF